MEPATRGIYIYINVCGVLRQSVRLLDVTFTYVIYRNIFPTSQKTKLLSIIKCINGFYGNRRCSACEPLGRYKYSLWQNPDFLKVTLYGKYRNHWLQSFVLVSKNFRKLYVTTLCMEYFKSECKYHRTKSIFKRVRKIAKTNYYLLHVYPSVPPATWINWTPNRRIFMKFNVSVF